MRMNSERQNQSDYDVYADLGMPYSATSFAPESEEFSLQAIQDKLGKFSDVEEPVTNEAGSELEKPTQQTLRMSYTRNYSSNVATAKKTSTKTKVAAICYVAIVLALVLGIALTSVSVSGVFAEAAQLNAEYSEVAAQVAALDEQLAVEDYETLAARAAELGYIDASQINENTFTYTELETRPAQNLEVETNWFDQFCDWICGVFGG